MVTWAKMEEDKIAAVAEETERLANEVLAVAAKAKKARAVAKALKARLEKKRLSSKKRY